MLDEMTDCEKQLRQNVRSIAATLENPPIVNDDGEELENAYVGQDFFGDEHVVTDAIVLKEGHNWGASFIPENDEGEIGYRGETYYTDDWIYTDNGDLVLSGVRHDDTRQMSGFDYLSDVLSVEFVVSGKSSDDYIGAEVLITFGGPNIWIETRHNTIKGAWGGDTFSYHYTDAIGIDDACLELWEMN